MPLFKKKKPKPAIIYVLEERLKNAKERGEKYFFYPLWSHELMLVKAWGVRNHIIIEPDHITDNNVFYKFFGF